MTAAIPLPDRLAILPTLREAVALLPRAITPYLALALAGLGLGLFLLLTLSIPLAIVRLALEFGGFNGGGAALVLQALPMASQALGVIVEAYVALCLLVAQYRLAADIRAGVRPRVLEILARPMPPLLALLSLALILASAALIGLSVFVIPGVLILLAFGQALPAMIFEGADVRDSLALSLPLTQGSRLTILGITLALLPLAFLPGLLSYLFTKAVGPGAPLAIVIPALASFVFLLFLVGCLASLTGLIIYQTLRARLFGATPPSGLTEAQGAPS